ncbi:MAG: hypothetical protein ACQEXX_18285 [Bacillota bacterium]
MLDIDEFPLVTDFELILRQGKNDLLGKHLYYYSNELGILSSFPWWDHVDKQIVNYEITDIPLGTITSPFDDCEQSWQIIIFSSRNYVYILQGDEPASTYFNTWYRVRLEDYLDAWSKLIRYVKENSEG